MTETTPAPTDRFLALGMSRETSARYVGVSATTFDGLVVKGSMPSPKRIGRRKVWNRHEIEVAFEALPADGENDPNEWDEALA
jgi:predicted DNA-binding transcriptional regulator AlpA